MTDDRGRSSSEELLREARQRVMDGDLYSDDHLETPQTKTNDAPEYDDPTPDAPPFGQDEELSAADIAQQLAEAREAENPASEESDEPSATEEAEAAVRARSGVESLPDWALDDQPSTVAAGSTGSSVPLSGSLAERIRFISEQQEKQNEVLQQTLQAPPPPGEQRDPWSTPSPEWQSRPTPTPPPISSMSWIRPVIFLIVIAVFGIGFVAAQLDGSEAIDELSVGECFNPGTATEVYSVPVVDCNELHEAELFGKVEIDGFGSTYPGDEELYDWVNARCEAQFAAYVGEPYADSRYWIEVFMPTVDGWEDGDRTGLCTAVLVDANRDVRPALGTARNWGAST